MSAVGRIHACAKTRRAIFTYKLNWGRFVSDYLTLGPKDEVKKRGGFLKQHYKRWRAMNNNR
jgi:hypothetical protein